MSWTPALSQRTDPGNHSDGARRIDAVIRPVRLLLVEDEPRTAERLQRLLEDDRRVHLVCVTADLRHAFQAVKTHDFDIALVDLGLPDGSGLDLIRRISATKPGVESLVVTVFGEERTVLQAIEAGATGYLIKGLLDDGLVDAILSVRNGGSPISPVIARILMQRLRPPQEATTQAPPSSLTVRELTILRQVAQGYVVDEIARKLFLSPHTVSSHVKNIYRKLQVGTRGQAIHEAYRLGLI